MKANQRNASTRQLGSTANFTRTALASACALAVGGFAAPSAFAQSFVYQLTAPNVTPTLPTNTYVDKVVNNEQRSRSSQINATDAGIPNTIGVFGPSGSPVVNNNRFLVQSIGNIASPTGNVQDNLVQLTDPTTIDLFVINPNNGSAGIVSSQIRGNATLANPVENRATFTGTVIGVRNTGQFSVAIPVTNNSMGADVQINNADSRIDGKVPTATTPSATVGSVAATNVADQLDAATTGTLNITASQTASNASGRNNSQAGVTGSVITVALTDAVSPTSAVTLTNNALSSTYSVNGANNQITMRPGGATEFTGSAVISSAQNNVETAGAGAASTASINATSGVIANLSLGATDTVLGAGLTVNNNASTASSIGNSAGTRTSTGVTFGNAVNVGAGIDVTGTSAATSNSVSATGGVSPSTSGQGDLLVFSQQRNSGTYLDTSNRGAITATVDTIGAAGSITSSRNSVTAVTDGNLAGNRVFVEGSATHDATSAVGNVQVNNLSNGDLTAAVNTVPTTGAVTVNAGFAGAATTGSITSNRNAVAALAEGSVASNEVRIDATSQTSPVAAGPAVSTATLATFAAAVNSGNSVSNVQANSGAGQILGQVVNGGVRVTSADQDGGGATLLGLNAASITSNQNSITSGANGAVANNTVALTGTTGTADAGVANVQSNAVAVTSRTTNSGVTVNAGGATNVAGSSVTLNRSTVSSSAIATDATNAIGVSSFSSLTLGANPASTAGAQTTAAGLATSTAGLSIASSQSNSADTTARTVNNLADGAGGSFAGVNLVNTAVTGTTVTVQANDVSATTIGNRVTNAFEMPTTSNFTPGAAANIASIASAQTNSAATPLALVDNASTTAVGVAYGPDMTGSTMTVVNNGVAANNYGNQGSNQITATGTSLVPTTATATGLSGSGSASGEFAVANRQDATGTNRIARITNTNVGVNQIATTATGDVSTSTLTVNNNSLASDARNNSATNGVSLTGYSQLDTTLGVSSIQSSSSAVRADVTESTAGVRVTGVGAGTIANSSVSVSRNDISALALGSTASNTMEAASSNTLSGNAAAGIVSGVTGGLAPAVTADYAVANQQSQTGGVRAEIAATARLQATDGTNANAAAITGTAATPVTITNNSITGTARGTDAGNSLTLSGTSSATGLTGAVGSGQTGSGAIVVNLAGTAGSANMVGVDALSVTTVPVSVTNNTIAGSGLRNFAANNLAVSGGTVTGRTFVPADGTGTDFTVANTQSNTAGAVTTNVDAGTVGVVADLLSGNPTTVNNNAVSSGANQNTSINTLGVTAQGAVTATAIGSNTQTSNAGAVTANVGGNGAVSVGATELTAATGVYTNAAVSVARNEVSTSASRNVASTGVTVTGNSIAGSTNGTDAMFTATNTQTSSAAVLAQTLLNTVGTQGQTASGGNVTVTNNLLSSAAGGNATTGTGTSVSLTADQTITASGLAISNQTSTAGDINAATSVGTGIGQLMAGTITNGTATVTNNTAQSSALRNNAVTSASADAGTSVLGTGLVLPTAPATISAVNTQSVGAGGAAAADVSGGDIGMSAATLAGAAVSTVTRNDLLAEAADSRGRTTASITATNAVTGSGMARSTQTTASAGEVVASVSSNNTGMAATAANAATATATVTNNTQIARGSRNEGTNTLTVDAGTITGDTGAALGATPASFTVDNSQQNNATGGVSASSSRVISGLSVIGNLTGAGTVQVSSNTDAAIARGNSSTNAATLTGTGAVTGSALTRNVQTETSAGQVRADNNPDLFGARITSAASTSLSATVTNNSATTEAIRNVATNTLAVEGLPVQGAAAAALDVNGMAASFVATNTQTESAASTGALASSSSATGFGVVVIGALSGTAAITTTNNTLAARAGANSANTTATLTSTGTVSGTALSTSTQTAQSAATGAQADASSAQFGLVTASAGAVPVTANRNTQSAQAINNAAGTTLTIDAQTITGDTVFAAANTAGAGFAATNTQTDSSVTGATATNTWGIIGAQTTTSATGTTVTTNNNTLEAIARSNSAGNTATLTATGTISGSAATLNSQTAASTGGVNVTHTGQTVGLLAGTATGVTVTASNNSSTSEGIRNLAENGLAVDATTVSGTLAMAGGANSFTARNTQQETAGGNSVIANTVGTIGVNINTSNLVGATVVASTNDVTSRARANSAITALDITGSSSVAGSGISANSQTTTPATNLQATAAVTTIGATVNQNVTAASSVTTSDNALTSEARRNVSTNTVTVDSGTITGETTLVAATRPASFTASNTQTAANGAGTTDATTTIGTLGLRTGQGITAATPVTVGNNTVAALSGSNQSSQSATIDASTQFTGSAMVTSNQQSATGAETATVNATTVGLSVGTAASTTTASPVTVSTNTIAASSTRNDASNTLTVNGNLVTGSAGALLDAATTPASFTTNNTQSGGAASTATNTVTTLGVNVIGDVAGAGNNYTVGNNVVTARAGTNSATNTTNLGGVSSFTGTAATLNDQTATAAAAVTGTVSTTTVGSNITIGANGGTGGNLTVNNNTIGATGVQNVATNTLTGAAATMSASTLATTFPAVSAYAVGNTQAAAANATATNTYVTIGAQAPSTTGAGNAFSVTRNSVFAASGSNAATNTVTLTPTSGLDATTTSSVDSTQTSTAGDILAQVNAAGGGTVGVVNTTSTVAAPITVSNNVLSADATRNAVTNVLNAEGPSIAGGTLASLAPSYAVRNTQTGNAAGNVTAVNFGGLIGASQNSGAAGMTFGVVDNTVLAMARVNAADNRLSLNSGSTLSGSTANGTGLLTNTQTATTGTVSATAGGINAAAPLNIGVVPTGAAATLGAGSPITVTGNTVAAQGGGNTASNVIDAGATSAILGSTAPVYTYGALNTQTNGAAINMTVGNTNIGVNSPVGATLLSGSAVTVTGNQVSAIGYGNSATNAVVISGLAGGVSASAQLNNTQVNTGNVISTASNVNIGMVGIGLTNAAGGSGIVTNNSITVRAVGNSATNGIVSK